MKTPGSSGRFHFSVRPQGNRLWRGGRRLLGRCCHSSFSERTVESTTLLQPPTHRTSCINGSVPPRSSGKALSKSCSWPFGSKPSRTSEFADPHGFSCSSFSFSLVVVQPTYDVIVICERYVPFASCLDFHKPLSS